MKRLILSPDPFSVADSVGAAQATSRIQTVFPSEQDSLQEKGMRGAGLPEESGGFMDNPG